MMWDRIFGVFHRQPADDRTEQTDCGRSDDPQEAQRQREQREELEQREREARRMNDALDDLVNTIRRK